MATLDEFKYTGVSQMGASDTHQERVPWFIFQKGQTLSLSQQSQKEGLALFPKTLLKPQLVWMASLRATGMLHTIFHGQLGLVP